MRIDTLDLLAFYNIEGILRGPEFAFKCPFHNDRDPSANFNIDTSLWTCFRCKIGGNSIDFVSQLEDWDYQRAEMWLRNRYGGFYKPASLSMEISRRISKKEYQKYPEDVLEQYDYPTRYWDNREIGKKTQKQFELGFDRQSARATIPIRSLNGDLVGVQGRTVIEGEPNKYKFLYRCNKKQHLYGLHLIDHSDCVVVVEGVVAAIRLNGLGIPSVATMGSVVSWEQASHLSSFSKVYMLFDDDDAGNYGMFGPTNKPQSKVAAWKKIDSKVYIPRNPYSDIDGLSSDQIKEILGESMLAQVWVPILQSKRLRVA